MFLYGIDLYDATPYNLVIRVGRLSENDTVDIIAKAVTRPSFQETDESRAALADAALCAAVSHALFDFPNAGVTAKDGHVKVRLKVPEGQSKAINDRVNEILQAMEEVKQQSIIIDPYF